MFIVIFLSLLIGSFTATTTLQQPVQTKSVTPSESLEKARSVEIVFKGNQIFSSRELWSQMQAAEPNSTGTKLTLQTPLLFTALELDLERLRFFLETNGYAQARYEEPLIEFDEDHAIITVRIVEGPQFRIGKITVEGARYFSPERIVELSAFKASEIIDGRMIQENVYWGIKDAYGNEGYIQAEVNFVPTFILPTSNSRTSIVNVKLEIDEGRLFRIRKINFLGHGKTDEAMLREQLLIKEGDVMRHNLLVASLRSLDALQLFEPLLEKHVITRTNDKEQTVDLDFQLTAKERE